MYAYKHGDRPLDGYTILRGLGRGAFGEVYYAVSDGGREVALKVIQQNHEIELRGVSHCMNLKSPHLVTIFDVKRTSKNIPCVIMEFVNGPSLRHILKEQPGGVGLAKALYLVREIGRGLNDLHEGGIVHRDLKPENIFYEEGYAKIGDYGLSKYISVSRHSGQTISVGTVHYMAPEIGSGNYTRGIDIYALGVIFYELLTGKVPFDGDSMGEILMKHLSVEPDLSEVDEDLRPILTKALAKKPEDRYASFTDMLAEIEDIPRLKEALQGVNTKSFGSLLESQHPLLSEADTIAAAPPVETAQTVEQPAPALPVQQQAPQPQVQSPPVANQRRGLSDSYVEDREIAKVEGRWQQSLAMGISTAIAMSLGLSMIYQNVHNSFDPGESRFFEMLSIILAGAFSAVLVGCVLGPKWRIEPGLPRRMLQVALGFVFLSAVGSFIYQTPVFFSNPGFFSNPNLPLVQILAGMLLLNWHARVSRDRPSRFSILQAFTAAFFGMVADMFVFQMSVPPIVSGGMLASMSLVANGLAPFGSRRMHASQTQPNQQTPSPQPAPQQQQQVHQPQPQAPQPQSKLKQEIQQRVEAHYQKPEMPQAQEAKVQDEAQAPPPPPTTPSFKSRKLVRPRSGGVIAGVCAGFANRYDWEAVWIRLIFILATLITSGFGILIYIVFWACMPKSPPEDPFQIPQKRRKRRPHTPPQSRQTYASKKPEVKKKAGAWFKLLRGFWIFTSILALGGGLSSTAFLLFRQWDRGGFEGIDAEETLMFVPGFFMLALSIASFFLGRWGHRVSFIRKILSLPTLCITLTGFATGLIILNCAQYGQIDEEIVIGVITMLILCLFFIYGAFVFLRNGFQKSKPLPPGFDDYTPSEVVTRWVNKGYSTLGFVLIASATFMIAMGSIANTEIGLDLMREMDIPRSFRGDIFNFCEHNYHYPMALPLFVPGLMAQVFSRRKSGFAHLMRGTIGWLAIAMFLALIADQISNIPIDGLAGDRGDGSWSSLFSLVVSFPLALFAILLVVWPANKNSEPGIPADSEASNGDLKVKTFEA